MSFEAFAGFNGEILTAPLSAYRELLAPKLKELKHEVGMDDATFAKLVEPMIDRFLGYVHLLPASESHHHARIGGLAIHAIEVATLAARASHNAVIDYGRTFNDDLELRAKRKRVWPMAAATTGLLHDLGKPLIDQVIVSETGEVWNPFREDLVTWATARRVNAYTVQWRAGARLDRHVSFSMMLCPLILGPEGMAFLTDHGRDVLEAMVVALSGVGDDSVGLRLLVDEADQRSCAADRESMRLRWRESAVGGHPVVNRVLEAARAMIAGGNWVPNALGSPLWITDSGVYLVWKAAVTHIVQWLKESGRGAGIPSDADRLAEFMVDAQVAKPQVTESGGRTALWRVVFSDASGKSTSSLSALLIPESGSILPPGVSWTKAVVTVTGRDGGVIEERQGARAAAPNLVDPPTPRAAAPPSTPVPDSSETVQAGAPSTVPESALSSEPDSAAALPPEQPAQEPLAIRALAGEIQPVTEVAASASQDAPVVEGASDPKVPEAPQGMGEPLPLEAAALNGAGAFGVFLERVAREIKAQNQDVARVVIVKSGLVCMRWPHTAAALGEDPKRLATAIKAHAHWLASEVAGRKLEENKGITMTLQVREGAWNALVANKELSEAFLAVTGRPKSQGKS
ncbi:MAG: MobH family relaxase [Rhodanobacter sp.]